MVLEKSGRKKYYCKKCGDEVCFDAGRYRKRHLCGDCLNNRLLENKCKKDVSVRQIRNHSRRGYIKSGGKLECFRCGYSAHVDVCHIKPVVEFSGNSKIGDINRISNLIALCPNCHWELDHGVFAVK